MRKPRLTVDPKVYDLAKHFLVDVKNTTPEDTQELAEDIQETIEDFITAIHESENPES